MEKIKNLMVALDFSGHDKHILDYVNGLLNRIQPESIFIIHIAENVTHLRHVSVWIDVMEVPESSRYLNRMKEAVEENIDVEKRGRIQYEVFEGAPMGEMLHWLNKQDIDLVVVGQKSNEEKGSGIKSNKIARKSPCSVVFVPNNCSEPNRILVPVDFSADSGKALVEAIELNGEEIICYHSLFIPPNETESFYKDDFRGMLEASAYERFEEFCSEMNIESERITFELEWSGHLNPAIDIYNKAKTTEADLIIIGYRGKTGTIWPFIGSVAEKLSKINRNIPIWIMKDKKEVKSKLEKFVDSLAINMIETR